MKKRNIIVIGVLFLVIIILISHKKIRPERNVQISVSNSAAMSPTANTQAIFTSALVTNRQTNVASTPAQPATRDNWKWLNEMGRKDPNFDYKAPISFYGRVVDESNNPIGGVNVALSCTDASEATGETTHSVISDDGGLFSLKGAHGKSLLVTSLARKGYTESVVKNKFSFNYGYFSDPYFFSPDPNNPVVFVMHKDGPREPLVKVNSRFPAFTNQPTVFNLGGDISTSVRIDILQNQSQKAGKGGAWMVQISVPSGGIQISTNEFPIEAPDTGYEPSIIVDGGTAKPATWILAYGGGQFFVKTATGYGMMQLQMMAGSPHLQILSYYNPNNSRNLQP